MSFHRSTSASDSDTSKSTNSSPNSSPSASSSVNPSANPGLLGLLAYLPSLSLFSYPAKSVEVTECHHAKRSSIDSEPTLPTLKKFEYEPNRLIDVINVACKDFKMGSVTPADRKCADEILGLCEYHYKTKDTDKDADKAEDPSEILLQIICSIIGENFNQETVDLDSSVALRNKLIKALFCDYLIFEEHFNKIKNKSSKSHTMFLEIINAYYDSIAKSYFRIDYAAILLALNIFRRALLIQETTDLGNLLQFQKLAVTFNCPVIRYELAKKIFVLIGEKLAAGDDAKQSAHDKFLMAMHHYHSTKKIATYEGVFRAMDVMSALFSLEETALMKGLISIQAIEVGSNTLPVSREEGYEDLNKIGSVSDPIASKLLLAGSSALREELKKLIIELVELDQNDHAIQLERCKPQYEGKTAAEIEKIKNRTLLVCLARELQKKMEAGKNKVKITSSPVAACVSYGRQFS